MFWNECFICSKVRKSNLEVLKQLNTEVTADMEKTKFSSNFSVSSVISVLKSAFF